MSLAGTIQQLEAAIDSFDSDGLAAAVSRLIDLVGAQSALALVKALLAERDMYRPRPPRPAFAERLARA